MGLLLFLFIFLVFMRWLNILMSNLMSDFGEVPFFHAASHQPFRVQTMPFPRRHDFAVLRILSSRSEIYTGPKAKLGKLFEINQDISVKGVFFSLFEIETF